MKNYVLALVCAAALAAYVWPVTVVRAQQVDPGVDPNAVDAGGADLGGGGFGGGGAVAGGGGGGRGGRGGGGGGPGGGGGGGRGGRGGGGNTATLMISASNSGVAVALADLQAALQDNSTPDVVIKQKLEVLRVAKAKADEELKAARLELQGLVTLRQEAILIWQGYLE